MITCRMEWQDGSRRMILDISVPENKKPADLPDLNAMVTALVQAIDQSPLSGLFLRPIGPVVPPSPPL